MVHCNGLMSIAKSKIKYKNIKTEDGGGSEKDKMDAGVWTGKRVGLVKKYA